MTVHDDVISHVNITEVKSVDGGTYSCRAQNSVGSVTHAARLNVYGELVVANAGFFFRRLRKNSRG